MMTTPLGKFADFREEARNERECRECLYTTSHPLGLTINDEGICSGCLTHREKKELDWGARLDRLKEILKSRARASRAAYDCVVPVRGTPEYFYLVKLLVEDCGVRPLLVNYNSQLNSLIGIRNLSRLVERFDLDMEQHVTNPLRFRDMVRHSIFRLGTLRWPALAGEASFSYHVAEARGIPTVVWPFHDSIEQVGSHSYVEEASFSVPSWTNYSLLRISPASFFSAGASLAESLKPSFSLDGRLVHSVVGLYAANYVPWDSRAFAESAVVEMGALACQVPRTFDTYDKVDDVAYMRFHDQLKFVKFGYGRVRDSLVREIRFGRVSKVAAREIEASYSASILRIDDLDAFGQWLRSSRRGLEWMLQYWTPKARSRAFGTELAFSAAQKGMTGESSRFRDSFMNNSGGSLGEEPLLVAKGLSLSEELEN